METVAFAFAVFLASFAVTLIFSPNLMLKLRLAKITGVDVHKKNRPELPEMGGLGILCGFIIGILLSAGLLFFTTPLNVLYLFAISLPIFLAAIIGIVDDIIDIRQGTKLLLPLVASIPLVFSAFGDTSIFLPYFGYVDFGLLYPFILVPIAFTAVTNLSNMFAGWNGFEAGHASIIFAAFSLVLLISPHTPANLLSLAIVASIFGASLAFLKFNWYPAKAFIGDVGTLMFGACIAVVVITAHLEFFGVILMLPFIVDFLMKARHRFPKTFGKLENGVLVCKSPKGLGQYLMCLSGGIHEKKLVLFFLALETVFAVSAIVFQTTESIVKATFTFIILLILLLALFKYTDIFVARKGKK
ncbi:MAG: hypothetical protein NT157_00325 [Candidatus Micrarchaeota archaeon]|nr:hypothetical protein [Candidatus Micrarchaeota archaeon]